RAQPGEPLPVAGGRRPRSGPWPRLAGLMGLWLGFRLLLGVKVRLLLRSFARRNVRQTVFLVLVLAAILVPAWPALAGAARAAVGMAVACLLRVLVAGVVLHMLLAALGRFLRREWSRAVAGLLFGLAFAAPSLAFNRHIGTGQVGASLDRRVPEAAWVARRLP